MPGRFFFSEQMSESYEGYDKRLTINDIRHQIYSAKPQTNNIMSQTTLPVVIENQQQLIDVIQKAEERNASVRIQVVITDPKDSLSEAQPQLKLGDIRDA